MKKDSANISFWVSDSYIDKIKKFEKTNRLSKTKLIEVALTEYLKREKRRS